MTNLMNDSDTAVVDSTVLALGQDSNNSNTAVLEQTDTAADAAVIETAEIAVATPEVIPDATPEITPENPEVQTPAVTPAAAPFDGTVEYTRDQLMAARHLVLSVKRSARQQGFGQQAGKTLRSTVGYKFDSMDVMEMLTEMTQDGFLVRYKNSLEQWFAGLNKSATDGTLKRNKGLYDAALALAADPTAFKLLVQSLQILCARNQDWREAGNHLSLPMNGHRAVLDLFGINVTNARRLALTAG